MSTDLHQLTDAQLSETFAVEAAGWEIRTEGMLWHPEQRVARIIRGSALEDVRRKMSLPMDQCMAPDFATSFDAALPWLEQWHDADPDRRDVKICLRIGCDWLVGLRTRKEVWDRWSDSYEVAGPLPRAIASALLLARRA